MASSDMRLRLVIRRQGLPDVKIVWPCTTSDDLTVARLLSDVNEVIPLESTYWGLEDYAVELTDQQGGSFECLHFQQINKILKNDDQVLIRSLLTDDLRRRRISGREQISSDGKHLFDGVAFGRPWLRAPRGRPQLELPPRKRARISHEPDEAEEDVVDEDAEAGKQLMLAGAVPLDGLKPNSVGLRVFFEDEDVGDADHELGLDDDWEEEEDDVDFVPNGEDASGPSEDEEDMEYETIGEGDSGQKLLEQELQLLKHDSAISGDDDETAALLEPDDSAPALPTISLGGDEEILPLRAAFPLSSVSSIRDEYKRQQGDLRRTHQALSLSNDPRLSFDEMMEESLCGPRATHSTLQQDLLNIRTAKRTRPLIEEIDAEPVIDQAVDEKASALTNANNTHTGLADEVSSDDETSSSGTSSDDTSSSDSTDEEDLFSSDESESQDEPPSSVAGPASSAGRSPGNSDSSGDDSEYSSDSDSSDDSSDSNSKPSTSTTEKAPITNLKASSAESQVLAPSPLESHNEAPPGLGLSKTQKRNMRRRRAQAAKNAQAQVGDLTMCETVQPADAAAVAAKGGSQDLQARKAALLASIGQENTTVVTEEDQQAAVTENTLEPKSENKDEPQRRRMRVDMGAGRRMLFGALGMKNPKTKEEEQKIRDGLLKGVKPLKNHRIMGIEPKPAPAESSSSSSSSDDSSDESSEDEQDPDAWRDKISYRAVECCQEGIVLSEPPFPFVQRWDPQQQFGATKKRKRKSQAVFDEEHVGHESMLSSFQEENYDFDTPASRKKARTKGRSDPQAGEDENNDTTMLNYDDPVPPAENPVADMDDLPELPDDINSLPPLVPGDAKLGMVITWKEWSLSKGMSWTPQLKSVTAFIVKIEPDRKLGVLLARRDRKSDEREFDPETGERIYSKFEMPGVDDEEDVQDDGHRTVSFDDMLEPRVVQHAPFPDSMGQMSASVDEHHVLGQNVEHELLLLKEPQETPDALIAEESFGLAVSQDLGSSASIPSGQPLVVMDNNPFSQLFNVSTSAGGSNNAPKDSSMLDTPDAESTPRQRSKPNSSALLSEKIVVVEESGNNGDVIADLGSKQSITASSELVEASKSPNDMNDNLLEQALSATVDPKALQQSFTTSDAQDMVEQPQNLAEEQASVIPETLLDQYVTPVANGNRNDLSGSSSPIPSLEEIFYTAAVARQTKSPRMQPQGSESNHKFNSDPGYLDAMQKLDEGDESDAAEIKKSSRMLFKSASQPVKTESTSTPRKRSSKKKALPFVVPAGSQVIDLMESAPGSPDEVASPAVSNRSADSNGSTVTKKKKTTSNEAFQSVKTRGLAFNSSPSANTRQRKNSSTSSASKRGRGRPRKTNGRSD